MSELISETDELMFAQACVDVKPLQAKETRAILPKHQEDNPGQQYRRERAAFNQQELDWPLSLVLKQKLSPDDWLVFKRDGIQTGVYKNLRLGKYPVESSLNLIRHTPEHAREQLLKFVDDCQLANIRTASIFFGRNRHTNLLIKSYLSQWLPELEAVQAFHTAQKYHGGNAAIYVLLRKSEAQRIANSECHAARRSY